MLEKDENNYSEGFIPSQNSGEIININTTDNSNPFESKESEEQIDQKNWIRCVVENYSYTTNSSSDEDISNYLANNNFKIPLIFYINKDWNNKELFDFFLTNTSAIYKDNESFLKNLNDYSPTKDIYSK